MWECDLIKTLGWSLLKDTGLPYTQIILLKWPLASSNLTAWYVLIKVNTSETTIILPSCPFMELYSSKPLYSLFFSFLLHKRCCGNKLVQLLSLYCMKSLVNLTSYSLHRGTYSITSSDYFQFLLSSWETAELCVNWRLRLRQKDNIFKCIYLTMASSLIILIDVYTTLLWTSHAIPLRHAGILLLIISVKVLLVQVPTLKQHHVTAGYSFTVKIRQPGWRGNASTTFPPFFFTVRTIMKHLSNYT